MTAFEKLADRVNYMMFLKAIGSLPNYDKVAETLCEIELAEITGREMSAEEIRHHNEVLDGAEAEADANCPCSRPKG